MTEPKRWLTEERLDSYRQKATRTQAGGLSRDDFMDCLVHDLELERAENAAQAGALDAIIALPRDYLFQNPLEARSIAIEARGSESDNPTK